MLKKTDREFIEKQVAKIIKALEELKDEVKRAGRKYPTMGPG